MQKKLKNKKRGSYLDSRVLLFHHPGTQLTYLNGQPPIDRNQKNCKCKTCKKCDANLLMEEVQRHSDLNWKTPHLMEARTEVNDSIGVNAHEVDHFSNAES